MQSYTAALFNSGPAMRLLDLAIRVQESAGELSLDDEVRRYIRLVAVSNTAEWNCSAQTAAALLDFTADFLQSPSDEPTSHVFREKLARAADDTDPADYLRTLAGVIRILDRDPAPEFSELPLSRWEADLMFPRLSGFTTVLVDDIRGGNLADAARPYIASEHPYCPEFLAPLAAEAHRALVLFPGTDALRKNLSHPIPWITADALRELLATVDDHMLREHS